MNVDDNIVHMILDECNVYPKQDRETVRDHTDRILTVINAEKGEEPSKGRLVRKVSKAMDLKSRMEKDCWIKSDNCIVELEEYR